VKKVTIVGIGALGSHLVQFLRSCGAELTVVDFDRVEQKNVASQFHGRPGVGKLKVQALEQNMNFLFGAKLKSVSSRLTPDNAVQLLYGSDLVVDCLDNGESRRTVQAFVRRPVPIPCLHGALAADGGFGRVVWDERFEIDDVTGGAPTCEAGEHLPFVGIVSCYLARSAQEFLSTGKKVGWEVSPGGAVRT
jgi:molybdopterin/thiamine biosynthesis adenylyltransferase